MMKKKMIWMFTAILFCGASMTVEAQNLDVAEPYFTTKDMPDMVKFLPAPPDTTSTLFVNDIMQYMWGKTMRLNPERAEIAKRDAVYGLETIIAEFSEPFGLQISKSGTPAIYKLMLDATATCDSICTLPKIHYMRKRPFARFNEPSLVPEQEESHRTNGSYPSGHTILGWSSALLLSEINPDRADTIIARGYMYGESRVIAGYHWQSDVDAARLAASVAYAKIHTSERFLQQMAQARQEFQQLTGVRPATINKPQTDSAVIYDLQGRQVDAPSSQGVYINNGKKVMMK